MRAGGRMGAPGQLPALTQNSLDGQQVCKHFSGFQKIRFIENKDRHPFIPLTGLERGESRDMNKVKTMYFCGCVAASKLRLSMIYIIFYFIQVNTVIIYKAVVDVLKEMKVLHTPAARRRRKKVNVTPGKSLSYELMLE